jgi:uncharacterized membrane protein
VQFCPACGKPVGAPAAQAQQQYQAPPPPPPSEDGEIPADPNDVAQNKTMAILAYIIFFIPLITGDHKKSPFVKFHTNQGTILFFLEIVITIVATVTCGIGSILYIAALVFWIIGIMNVVNGKMKPLPLIGKFQIIK